MIRVYGQRSTALTLDVEFEVSEIPGVHLRDSE